MIFKHLEGVRNRVFVIKGYRLRELKEAEPTRDGRNILDMLDEIGQAGEALFTGGELPEGWERYESMNAVSAHYKDSVPERSRRFYVPVLTIWNDRPGEVEIGGFTRFKEDECQYCGACLTDSEDECPAYVCPACGAC